METLIIQVDCRPYARNGPPQLGITVEAPFSQQRSLLHQNTTNKSKQQALAATTAAAAATTDKDSYHNHDYQNLEDHCFKLTNTTGGSTKLNSISKIYSSNNNNSNHKNGHSSLRGKSRQHVANVFNGPHQIHEGLQITQIQSGSIIDRIGQFKIGDIIVECNGVNLQRPFGEAQRTLKQFVVEHTSHGPLVLKVLRKSASSSSIPSTTGSQITVIENRENNHYSKDSVQKQLPIMSANLKQTPSSHSKAIPSTSESPTSPKSQTSSKASRHLVGALNTRKIGVKHTIRLKKGNEGGFGIKIAERDNMHGTRNRPIYITAITTTGSAYRDGRLNEGDMLLEINGHDLHGRSQPEVTKMLKGVGANEEVEFVVSRQEFTDITDDSQELANSMSKISLDNDCDKSLIDLDVPEHEESVFETSNHQFEQKIDNILNIPTRDGPGVYVYDIPLNDTKSAGLGLYLKYPRRADDRKDLGIWIEKVITGGAAWKDSRLQPDDQILAINGINLVDRSNAEASETLTAAVCRGIGPEATPNIIRLKIHRREPAVVAKILQGTNTRYSDIIPSDCNRAFSIFDKNIDNSCDSYQTALDNTTQHRDSSDSSNQNSQNDSAMSPQTQASNSLKLTSSYNERLDQSGSDKTNETTSSAISQITNSTNKVPTNDVITQDRIQDHDQDSQNFTQPKSIHTDINTDLQVMDCTSSSQSWDDVSTDATTGEERFQRDGFGRQSISEKRHAQLNAKCTDTLRRNQQMREEREQQRLLEEQLARQRRVKKDEAKDEEEEKDGQGQKSRNQYQPVENHNLATSNVMMNNDFKSQYDIMATQDRLDQNIQFEDGFHREVPVDVHIPAEPKVEPNRGQYSQDNSTYIYNNGATKFAKNHPTPNLHHHQEQIVGNQANRMVVPIDCCMKCGSTSPCLCETNLSRSQVYAMSQRDGLMFKRSNSLESVQQHQVREGLVVPRAGNVRVARNRKVNESFRAAVDRSYEGSTNESNSRYDQYIPDHRHAPTSIKMSGSIANSNASTSNDERYLISNKKDVASTSNGTDRTHKKSSSLLSKFLKFGSMKKKKKNRNVQEDTNQSDMKSSSSKSTRDSERSQSSKSSHSRTHSSQSHPNLNNNNNNNNQHHHHQCNPPVATKPDVMMDGHMYNHNLKQAVLANSAAHQQNGFDMTSHQARASMPMCQQKYQTMHNPNTHYKLQVHPHLPMTQAKYAHNMMVQRPQVGNNLAAHSQYSHLQPQMQHQHQLHLATSAGHIFPHDNGHDQLYSSTRNQMILNPQMPNTRLSNGFQPHLQQAPQWQSSSHFQAPNGLWVTNSTLNDNEAALQNSIYGTVHQHHENPAAAVANHQRGPQHAPSQGGPHVNHHNFNTSGGPYVSSMNNSNTNGMFHHAPPAQPPSHQAPLLPTHSNQAVQHQLHHQAPFGTLQHNNNNSNNMHNHQHQQPQHIYYYDF